MQPTKFVAYDGEFTAPDSVVPLRDICLPGSTHAEAYAAAFNGHAFEVIRVDATAWKDDPAARTVTLGYATQQDARPVVPFEAAMEVYGPIDPRIKAVDVAGAVRAFPNADNDGWLFEHCDADWHHDHEYRLEAAVQVLFQHEIDEMTQAVFAALYADNSAVAVARRAQLDMLTKVRGGCLVAVTLAARRMTIGQAHQNPADSHVHDIVTAQLEGLVKQWTEGEDTTLASRMGTISAELGRIRKRAADRHTYERRWEQEARLKALFASKETATDGG